MEGYLNKDSKWGIVLIDKDNINTIYTSTREQPILIGFSPKENQIYVAS
jgi:glucosamine 6-phosphate synthetase-like amidotransferase/phosphosugar isomerase protein